MSRRSVAKNCWILNTSAVPKLASGGWPPFSDIFLSTLLLPLLATAVFSMSVPRGFREAMEYISGRMADNSSVGAEKAANTKLASKPGGSCFWHWSIKLSFALLIEPVRIWCKIPQNVYKNKRVFFFLGKEKVFLWFSPISLKPMYIAINYLIFPLVWKSKTDWLNGEIWSS